MMANTLKVVNEIQIQILYDADDIYINHYTQNTESSTNIDEEKLDYNDKLNCNWLVPLIGTFFFEGFKLFSDCLHSLMFTDQEKEENINEYNTTYTNNNDRKLLYILGNVIYCKDQVLYILWKRFIQKSNIIPVEYLNILITQKKNLVNLYNILEQMIFDKYVRNKTLILNKIIDSSLLMDGMNWNTNEEPKNIRNNCLQLLLQFVFIHNEVYNSSKEELDNVLRSLLEKIADHLLSTINLIDSFSKNGALQLLIEIEFIEKTLEKYLEVEGSKEVFHQITQLLLKYIIFDGKIENTNSNSILSVNKILRGAMDALIKPTRQSTVVMFSCFQKVNEKHEYSQSSTTNSY